MTLTYKILIFFCFFYPGILLYFYGFGDFDHYHQIIPNWTHNFQKNLLMRNRSIENQPELKRNYFFNHKNLIYYNRQGESLHKISTDSKTLISPDNSFYLVFSRLGQSIELFNNRGEKFWALDTYAVPFITRFRKNVALLSSDLNTLTIYDNDRNLILPPTYLGTLITDYDVCQGDDQIILGTIEGDIYLFDYFGKQLFKKNFKDSRFSLIKSVVCSITKKTFLVIDGLYPEWVTRIDEQGEILWRQQTDQNRRTPSDLFIDYDNSFVLDVQSQQVQILSLDRGEKIGIIHPSSEIGEIKRAVYDSTSGWLLFGFNGDLGYEMQLLNKELKMVWKNSMIQEFITYAEIQQYEEGFFFLIHTDTSIYNYHLIL